MALLQDKTHETLIHTTYTYTHQKYTDTIDSFTHNQHTSSAFTKSARNIILCFWCPSLFRDLLFLSEELLGNAGPLLRNPANPKNRAIHQMQKKLSGAPAVAMNLADQVNPNETSDPSLSSPNKSPSLMDLDRWKSRWKDDFFEP